MPVCISSLKEMIAWMPFPQYNIWHDSSLILFLHMELSDLSQGNKRRRVKPCKWRNFKGIYFNARETLLKALSRKVKTLARVFVAFQVLGPHHDEGCIILLMHRSISNDCNKTQAQRCPDHKASQGKPFSRSVGDSQNWLMGALSFRMFSWARPLEKNESRVCASW